MSSRRKDPSWGTPEALLALEREVSPAGRQTRERVMNRVRVSLHDGPNSHPLQAAPRRWTKRASKLVAVPIVLGGTWALAFQVGHELTAPETPAARVERPLLPSGLSSRLWLPLPPALQAEEAGQGEEASEAAEEERTKAADEPGIASERPVPTRPHSRMDAYAMELPVLQPAQRAVANRNFASALAPIAQHQSEFPSGVLAEEREALRVKVLVGLGRVEEAKRAAQNFRTRFPKSALHDRIDRLLRGSE